VIALAFGVFFAFFVTLLLVPSLYGIGNDVSAFFARVRDAARRKLQRGSHGEAETTSA